MADGLTPSDIHVKGAPLLNVVGVPVDCSEVAGSLVIVREYIGVRLTELHIVSHLKGWVPALDELVAKPVWFDQSLYLPLDCRRSDAIRQIANTVR